MLKTCKECANYDHKNLKHTKACGKCVTTRYQDGTESDPSNWRALPPTKADRIRAMSDEELADYFSKTFCHGYGKPQFIEWLKQPVEGE